LTQGKQYSSKIRLECVQNYMILGNCEQVGAITGVPAQTIRLWRMQDWWKDLENEFRHSENLQVTGKLKRIVEKSLTAVEERLDAGDWQYDPKTGALIRRPVLLRDAAKVASEFLERQQALQERVIEKAAQPSVEEALKRIAAEFVKIARGEHGKELSEGIRQLPGQTGADQATGAEECSAPDSGEVSGPQDLDGRGPQAGIESGGNEHPGQSADPASEQE